MTNAPAKRKKPRIDQEATRPKVVEPELKVTAALLYKPELLNGSADLVAPSLFREPVNRDIAVLRVMDATGTANVEKELYGSGQYSADRLDEELSGLSVTASLLDKRSVSEAVLEMTRPEAVDEILSKMSMTDCGNAQRFVARHGRNVRHIRPWKRWLIWTGQRWEHDTTGEVERHAKNTSRCILREAASTDDHDRRKQLAAWAGACESKNRIESMLSLAWSEPGIAIMPDRLDCEPWLLNCTNGTIDLQTGKLQEHRPADLITRMVNVEYDPDAKCPVFDKFLHETTCGSKPLAGYLQRLIGLGLTGDISEQILPVLWGQGGNGKNTLLDLVLDMLGDYAGIAPPDMFVSKRFTGHPCDIMDLMGKRLVIASETKEGGELRTEFAKRATGDKKLKGRGMRQDFTEFDRSFNTLLVTNHKPRIEEQTHAIWRRVKLVPFLNTVTEADDDKHLGAKLRRELPGVLAWAVRGCLDWQRHGMDTPVEVKVATADYKRESNWLEQFSSECLDFNPILHATSAGLAEALRNWCVETGLDGDIQKLRTWLKDQGCKLTQTRALGRCWKGVALTTANDGEVT